MPELSPRSPEGHWGQQGVPATYPHPGADKCPKAAPHAPRSVFRHRGSAAPCVTASYTPPLQGAPDTGARAGSLCTGDITKLAAARAWLTPLCPAWGSSTPASAESRRRPLQGLPPSPHAGEAPTQEGPGGRAGLGVPVNTYSDSV